jgi:3-dehydroquinate dehydratase-2
MTRTTGVAQLLALHGPNLDLLGSREPGYYGHTTLAAIDAMLRGEAERAGHALSTFQSSAEHALIERIHAARREDVAGIVFNPAGYTHTSVALRDALLAVAIPFVEVHLSNPQAREPFRRHSYFSDIAVGTVAGFGAESYRLGLLGLLAHLARAA